MHNIIKIFNIFVLHIQYNVASGKGNICILFKLCLFDRKIMSVANAILKNRLTNNLSYYDASGSE